jgi:hypothetical protein
MIFIPIGVDCGNADFLRKIGLRKSAYPFDWIVTYNGISDIIKNDFIDYLPNNFDKFNNIYKIFLPHHLFPNDNEKILRRIDRFKSILEKSNEKVIFIRKGHATHHHKENNMNIIKSDLDDAEDLDNLLKSNYPNLNYEIIVTLICGDCFDRKIKYTSCSTNIKVYNISMQNVDDNIFNNLCKELFVSLDNNLNH